MQRTTILALAIMGLATPVIAGPNGSVRGTYVEARTAEVFTGGCIMGSEAETTGRQAVLAWHIDAGSFEGVALDGLSVVAAVAADRNLGIREIGGEAPANIRAAVMVDERADAAQRAALVSLVRELAGDLAGNIVHVEQVPVAFDKKGDLYTVDAGDARLSVSATFTHDPSCGAMQWFHPFSSGADASVGMTKAQVYWGETLGSKWQQTDRRSAFVGSFSY